MKWLPYQLDHIYEQHPWVLWAKTRRAGISESAARRRALRAAGIKLSPKRDGSVTFVKPVQQNVFSATKPQAITLLDRIVRHVRLIEQAHPQRKLFDGEPGKEIVRLTNGIELKAFPASSRAARGEWGDVLLDEFANVMYQEALWAAAEPIASATPGNPEGFQIEVISTPLGDDNLFHRMAEGDMKRRFKQFRVTMQEAMAQGFVLIDQLTKRRLTFEEFRELKGDDDIFSQEYMCSFLASSQRYISREVWDAACYTPAEDEITGVRGGYFAGMDVGEKGHGSAIVEFERNGEALWQVDECEKRRFSAEQWEDHEEWARGKLKRSTRFAVDATSIGSMFANRMQNAFPGQCEAVKFTPDVKEALASGLRYGLARKTVRPLSTDTDLRRSVLSLRRTITGAGTVRISADQKKNSHGDEAWAAALAVSAAGDVTKERSVTTRIAVPKPSEIAGKRHRRGEMLR